MINVSTNRRQQLQFIGLTEADLRLLNEHKHYFEQITNIVVDLLYDHITKESELVTIIQKFSTVERLKQTQKWYFMSLVEGVIDEGFIEKRLHIGGVHSRIGLTTNWYLGTYMTYLDITASKLKALTPETWMEVVLSLSKMFNLDSQFVLEAYDRDEKQKIQALSDRRQETLALVSKAVQDLVSMMVELGGSSQSVADSANHTAELQEQAYEKVNLLNTKVSEINAVGQLLQEVSDQTHLLGLNAAIEAAHVGSQGAGFGVVANEIRKLAAHSKDSLTQIKVKLAEITKVLHEVMSDSENTVKLARQQAASSQELTAFVNMIETVTEDLERIH
ncbi:MAG: globin-coupled sensor protein [Candidatus Cohnella colombiensis]|uniref:Globin-coupled sensor protein n=1 Tax=Candidatus Cohnella colombiensis TaxID=3121368 RepID=A0AA95JF57_9BACL|nr:MAG: globin-coupled sensor protein [Cohnella sp.]